MNFAFSEEQQMLQDTTRRFIVRNYSFEHRSQVLDSEAGWCSPTWRELGELGLLAVDLEEADGGIGADPVAVMLVAQAVGEGLLLEPFLSSAVLATRAIATLGSDEQRARWLPELAAARTVAVLAHDEGDVVGTEALAARAHRVAEGYRLTGHKRAVYHAPIADLLLVSALDDEGKPGVFAVLANTPGVAVSGFVTVDGQRAGDITLSDVFVGEAERLPRTTEERLDDVLDHGLAVLCGEALGVLERTLKATISYSRDRRQFGAPIGSFQALSHQMADMLIEVEQARSMTYLATDRSSDPDRRARRRALSGAKALIGQVAGEVGKRAVQLHGGMGMSDELDVSHCFKRLLAFQLRAGSTEAHLAAYGASLTSL